MEPEYVERLRTVESAQTALPGSVNPNVRRPGAAQRAQIRAPSVESARTVENAEGQQWTVLGGRPQSPQAALRQAAQPPAEPFVVEPVFLGESGAPSFATHHSIATPPGGSPITSSINWQSMREGFASERDALIATAQQSRKQAADLRGQFDLRLLAQRTTYAAMLGTLLVLLVSHRNRGHDLRNMPIRPGLDPSRPGTEEGCHNMWVWLATLFLLDAVHMLLHYLEDLIEVEASDVWFTTAIDNADYVVLGARLFASWYGVFLVLNFGGFMLVSLLTVVLAVLLVATMQLVGVAAGHEHNMGVALVGILIIAVIVMNSIVSRATKSPCHGLLHTWALMLASVYAVSLFAALGFLALKGRDEWVRRKPQVLAAAEKAQAAASSAYDKLRTGAHRVGSAFGPQPEVGQQV